MKTLNFFLILILCLGSINLDAQINLKDKLKRQTNNRANKNVDQGINKSLDKVENGVKDLFKKKNKDNQDSAAVDQPLAGDQDSKQSLKAFSNYDFVPGDKVLLVRRFQPGRSGRFPCTMDN